MAAHERSDPPRDYYGENLVELLRDGVKNAEVMAAALAQIQEAMESGRPKVIIIRNRIDRP